MTQMRLTLAAVFAVGLAACTPPAEPPADAPDAPAAAPVAEPVAPAPEGTAAYAPTEALLAADGVTFPNPAGRGTGMTQTFGTAQADVISDVTLFRGAAPTVSLNSECGAGPLTFATWGDGLTLLFQDGTFAGWAAGDDAPRGFTTETGIGVGATVAQLRTAHPGVELATNSLGPEFGVDDIYGLASGTGATATVTNLWAGVSCNFR